MEHKQPRSLGMVLRTVRERCIEGKNGKVITQHEMFDKLCNEHSSFKLPDQIQALFDESETDQTAKRDTRRRRGDVVSGWERSEVHVPFPIQMRYASLIGIRNGILHVASAYYADAREFCDLANETEKQNRYLQKAKKNISQLTAFGDAYGCFLNQLENPSESTPAKALLQNENSKPKDAESHLNFIAQLINAYRTGKSSG